MTILTRDTLEKQFFAPQFRALFPQLAEKFTEYFKNPGCPCNHALIAAIVAERDRLADWFHSPITLDEQLAEIARAAELTQGGKREFWVLNTTIDRLQAELDGLPPGEKMVSIARWQDQVTVVIRNLDAF